MGAALRHPKQIPQNGLQGIQQNGLQGIQLDIDQDEKQAVFMHS